MTSKPLAELRVVEMGSSVAGPYAGWVLSELGAEVIKVEDGVTGDASRTWGPKNVHGQTSMFETMNNGKLSVTVDLKDANDVGALQRLIVDSADVVLQNLRPGFAERCGIGQQAMTAAKPSLIYCDLGAYGKGGALDALPGYDPLMQGFTGLAQATGTEDSPARVASPVTDFLTGMWAVIGILGALQTRRQSGTGTALDVSLMESGIALMTMFIGQIQSTGARPDRRGLHGPLVAPNSGYRTADGLIMVTCGTDGLFRKLCEAIDRADLLDRPEYASSTSRFEHRRELQETLERTLSAESRAHWMTVIGNAGVPVAPVNHVDEMMAHPQARAVGILQSLEGSDEPFETARLPVRFDGVRSRYTRRAPTLGEHTRQLLDPFREI
ncbi:MAG: CoA transferase [Pseudomonadota bacterium]